MLKVDKVVNLSQNMSWISGGTLSDDIHDFSKNNTQENELRIIFQQVYHFQNGEFEGFLGYAGRIISGTLKVGDTVVIVPSLNEAEVTAISKFKSNFEEAKKGDLIQVHIKDTIDISLGMKLVAKSTDFLIQKRTKSNNSLNG